MNILQWLAMALFDATNFDQQRHGHMFRVTLVIQVVLSLIL